MVMREATAQDVPAIFAVRTSVKENLLSMEQMAKLGITPATVIDSLRTTSKAWVAEWDGRVVGFSIANRESGSIFALFVLPEFEGKGLGSRLLHEAVTWLWDCGVDRIWLTTGHRSRAVGFYEKRGWVKGEEPVLGEYRFELRRPEAATE